MSTKNFTQFDTAAPLTSADYIVGYKADGTAELKATLNQVINLATTGGNSNLWNSTYTTVQANSASWEESAEILPTVTNYLSTNNVQISSLSVANSLTANGTVKAQFNNNNYISLVPRNNASTLEVKGDQGSVEISQNQILFPYGGTLDEGGFFSGEYNNSQLSFEEQNIIFDGDNVSDKWNQAYNIATTYQGASGSFATNTLLQSTSALLTPLTLTNTLTGQINSSIIPTVTNYLSTNNALLSSATISNTLSINSVQIRALPTANLFIGDSTTGNNNTTGSYNFVFGPHAGNALYNGSNNVFIGKSAGYSNSFGRSNIFIGENAGFSNQIASCNNFFGRFTGRFNTYGDYNNFFGHRAGEYNTHGNNNNFLGPNTGRFNTTGSFNNLLGDYAGRNNTTGHNNNFFGNYAGRYNITGNGNNFFGLYAGATNNFGSNNTIIGNQADVATDGLSGVIVIGTGAIATEPNQIVLNTGEASLKILAKPISSAGMNIFLGNSTTGGTTASGDNNFMVGFFAGAGLTNGDNNNFLGNRAGTSNSTGNNNNFLGHCAGRFNDTGSNNNFLGFEAGFNTDTGSKNNFLGNSAGRSNTTGNGNNFFGNNAGSTNTIGSNNTIIGTNANVVSDSLSGVIALGTNATAELNNELSIGSATWPLSTVPDSTLTGQVSSVILRLNGSLFKVPIIPV